MHDISEHLDEALRVYGGRPAWRPEVARACIRKAKVRVALGDDKGAAEAMARVQKIWMELVPKERRSEPMEKVIDEMVFFWSK